MAISLDFFLTEEEKENNKKVLFENPYKELAQKYEDIEKNTIIIPEKLHLTPNKTIDFSK